MCPPPSSAPTASVLTRHSQLRGRSRSPAPRGIRALGASGSLLSPLGPAEHHLKLEDDVVIPEFDSTNGTGAIQPRNDHGYSRTDDESDGRASWPFSSFLTLPVAFLLQGLKGRLAADPYFARKLIVECCLDAIIIMGVNFKARRERFLPELEFTLCQLAISLLSDFALVYLLAPSTVRSITKPGSFKARLEALPAHVFQLAPNGAAPFTLGQRVSTIGFKALQYGGVGWAMGCTGAASVHMLVWLRERLDPMFIPPATVQTIFGTGFAWSWFMASSSNVRYNIVNGCEDILYRQGPQMGLLGSVALRLLNNWAGAVLWFDVVNKMDITKPWIPA